MPSRARIAFVFAIVAFCAIVGWQMQLHAAPPLRDEAHYWPNARYLTSDGFPSLEKLRTYSELCTPLSLMLFGWADRLTGGGLPAARYASLGAVCATLVLFVLLARGPDRRVLPAALCLLAFPYFLGVGIHIYPDSFAILFTLLGLALFQRDRPWFGAIFFALAISSRQYMVAFPVGLALWEIAELNRLKPANDRVRAILSSPKVIAGVSGGLVLVSWIVFWGGFGPPGEVKRQAVSTAQNSILFYPQYSLYGLACLGLYFVLPRWVIFDRTLHLRAAVSVRSIALVAAVAICFWFFPPQDNFHYEIDNMGYFDRMIRGAVGAHSTARLIILGAFAWLAAMAFCRRSLASALVLVHLLMLAKAHIAWDKYELPMLVCLWFLLADERIAVLSAVPRSRKLAGAALTPA
ncbi:MAG: hypothetical protein JNK16_09440 [Phycisphaerales bacterium]|nr:hypothetical protein [Phycisphaerales bacterium]